MYVAVGGWKTPNGRSFMNNALTKYSSEGLHGRVITVCSNQQLRVQKRYYVNYILHSEWYNLHHILKSNTRVHVTITFPPCFGSFISSTCYDIQLILLIVHHICRVPIPNDNYFLQVKIMAVIFYYCYYY